MKCQMPQISWHGRDPVLSVDFQVLQSDIRRLASGGTDGHVVIWYVTVCSKNTVSIECVCDLSRHFKSVNVVRFSPSGEFLASGDDDGVIITWKLREKSYPSLDAEEDGANKEEWIPFKVLRGHIDDICDVSWSPNSEFLLSGSIDNSIIIWDVAKGQTVKIIKDSKGYVQGVAWDPLNRYLAALGSDRVLRIYNAVSKKVVVRTQRASCVESDENGVAKPNKLFHDDTLKSFCRRLTFTPDGELLFAPSGIKGKDEKFIHTTYAFSRYDLARPVLHLPTGSKYTLAVRCCPVLFKLREVKGEKTITPMIKLPYRVLIAVATQNGIFLYDSQQILPFAYVCNIHYAHLTDIAWSSDGRILIVSSTDGYCSFLVFTEGELGEIYIPPIEEPTKNVDGAGKDIPQEEKNTSVSDVKVSPKKVVENGNTDVNDGPCTPPVGDRSPRKQKSPQKTPTSQKKMPKMCPITSFFTSGKEKTQKAVVSEAAVSTVKPDNPRTGASGTVTAENNTEQQDVKGMKNVLSHPVVVTLDSDESNSDRSAKAKLELENLSVKPKKTEPASAVDAPKRHHPKNKKKKTVENVTIENVPDAQDVEMVETDSICNLPKQDNGTVKNILSNPVGDMSIVSECHGTSTLKKQKLENVSSTAKEDKQMKIGALFKMKTSQKTEPAIKPLPDASVEHSVPSNTGVARKSDSFSVTSEPKKPEGTDPPEKPKKRVQLIKLSKKV